MHICDLVNNQLISSVHKKMINLSISSGQLGIMMRERKICFVVSAHVLSSELSCIVKVQR